MMGLFYACTKQNRGQFRQTAKIEPISLFAVVAGFVTVPATSRHCQLVPDFYTFPRQAII
jgi:hypothetical protein